MMWARFVIGSSTAARASDFVLTTALFLGRAKGVERDLVARAASITA
jgi:hypothetical protein